MIVNKIKFPRKYKNIQLNNNQTKILNLQYWNLNLEEKLELILESSINNQQFVCRENKKTRENCGCSKPCELSYEAATWLVFIEIKICN